MKSDSFYEAGFYTPTKKCSKCGDHKPTSVFSKDNKSKDGLGYLCRECRTHQAKLRRGELAKINIKLNDNEIFTGDNKLCTGCKQEFPKHPDYWNRSNGRVGGLNHYCKNCQNEKGRESKKKSWQRNKTKYNKNKRYGRKLRHYQVASEKDNWAVCFDKEKDQVKVLKIKLANEPLSGKIKSKGKVIIISAYNSQEEADKVASALSNRTPETTSDLEIIRLFKKIHKHKN